MSDLRPKAKCAPRPIASDVKSQGVPSMRVAGVSLVEMLVAVALLSLVSIAALQLVRMTGTSMFETQGTLNQQPDFAVGQRHK